MKKLQEESPWKGGNTLSGGTNTLKSRKNSNRRLKGPNSQQSLDLVDQRSISHQHITIVEGRQWQRRGRLPISDRRWAYRRVGVSTGWSIRASEVSAVA